MTRTATSRAGRPRASGWALPFVVVLATMASPRASVQQSTAPPRDREAPVPDLVVDGAVTDPPTPGGAFLRSLAVPGWGHASIGSWGRAAVYATAQGLSWYTLVRTRLRLGAARERADTREDLLRSGMAREGVTDPAEIQARLEGDPGLREAEDLVSARERQQEDWIAVTIFLMLLGGADAFVSTHLKDFPDAIDVGAAPAPEGGVDLFVRLPVGGR